MTMHYYCSREISRVLQIGFRNPQPKINSNAQEFIKEARQSAFEKTHFRFLAKPKGQEQVCHSGRAGNREKSRTRQPSRRKAPGRLSCGARPRCHQAGRNQRCPRGLPVTPPGGDKDAGETHFPDTPGPAQSWKPAFTEEARTDRRRGARETRAIPSCKMGIK